MGILTALLTLLGSSTVGTIVGGVFAILNRKADIAAKAAELAHERERWGHEALMREKDLEHAKIEAQARLEVAQQEGANAARTAQITGDAATDQARAAAIARIDEAERVSADELKAAGKWAPVLIMSASLRRLVRPLLTMTIGGLAAAANCLIVWKLAEVWPDLQPAQRVDVSMQALAWLSAQGSMMFGFWFVARGTSSK